MKSTMMDFPLVLPAILERARRPFGAVETVSRMPDGSLSRSTLGQLYVRARRIAEALTKLGLGPGERVGTLMWNHDTHVAAYFGVPCAGGVLHTLNLRLSPEEIAYIANHAGDRFLFVDDVLLPLYEKFKDMARIERVFVMPLTGAPVKSPYESLEDLIASTTGDFEYPRIDENDPLGVCYTSGTTGKPKGVVYSHRSTVLHSFAVTMADGLALSVRDIVLPVVPQFHVNAWGIPFASVMCGAKLVMPGPKLDPESLLDLMEREKVTIAAGVPTVWLGILEALDKNPTRYKLQPGLRMVVGGSAAPESMIRAFDKHGLRVIHAWGMTEMSPVGTVGQVRREIEAEGEDASYAARARQGVAMPFVETRIMNDNGEAPWDAKASGELQVRGPWVAASYHDLVDQEGKWTSDGWLCTGDVATICPRGYVKICDRTKDLIKSGGEWISSVDLENALMGHPKVREACVIAIPHAKWVERPLAVIVPKDKADAPTDAELAAFLEVRFAKFWMPDAYAIVEAIPRTSSGKFLKAALREKYGKA
jgi:acyl-CoA synthetase (AMP-forming)/AMP-acid ligase II